MLIKKTRKRGGGDGGFFEQYALLFERELVFFLLFEQLQVIPVAFGGFDKLLLLLLFECIELKLKKEQRFMQFGADLLILRKITPFCAVCSKLQIGIGDDPGDCLAQ